MERSLEISSDVRSSAIELGFPRGFGGFRLAYGSTLELIDNHRPQFELPLPRDV
jgi:hypothetical protein